MREKQIYIKKHLKKGKMTLSWGEGGVSSFNWEVLLYSPRGAGVQISLSSTHTDLENGHEFADTCISPI